MNTDELFTNTSSALLQRTTLVERFVRYCRIHTTSDPESTTCPSTLGQMTLGQMLQRELAELGLSHATVDENGYVMATLHGTGNDVVGLLAHLDTSPQFCGKNVQPVFHENYNGQIIALGENAAIDPANTPHLMKCIGHTIITSNGETLLGADDKAGIAIIMTLLEVLTKNPKLPHPTIRVGFTPDEEIGRSIEKFPVARFHATVAFTLDGSTVGELNVENFEAWSMDVTIKGVSTHPGTAYGKMVNAMRHLAKFIDRLPFDVSPERTRLRQGFIHPSEIGGDAAMATCRLIVRAFDADAVVELCNTVEALANGLHEEEPRLLVTVERHFSYPNMLRFSGDSRTLIKTMQLAVSRAGAVPTIVPIRGGTDGAQLSARGLWTPNIFTGGMNFHGPEEWISTTDMATSLCTVLNLMALLAEEEK